MTIDDKLKWFVIAGDAIVKDAGINKKLLWHVEYVNHPRFPFRVHIECGKVKTGFAMEAKIKLTEFEKLFSRKITDVKRDQSKTFSLFDL